MYKSKKLSWSGFYGLLFLGIWVSTFSNLQAETNVWITGDTRGHLSACQHCPDTVGLGGIARRATLVKEFRGSGEGLLLDVGDFLYGAETAKTQGAVMVEAYNQIGYDAVNVSYKDFRQGLDVTVGVLQKAQFPLISANIRNADGELMFEPYVLKKAGGKTYAIVGITERPAGMDRLPHLKRQMQGVQIDTPQVALQNVHQQLAGKADAVILLYHGSVGAIAPLLEETPIPNLQLVVVSGESSLSTLGKHAAVAGTHKHGTRFTRVVLGASAANTVVEAVDITAQVESDQTLQSFVESQQQEAEQAQQSRAEEVIQKRAETAQLEKEAQSVAGAEAQPMQAAQVAQTNEDSHSATEVAQPNTPQEPKQERVASAESLPAENPPPVPVIPEDTTIPVVTQEPQQEYPEFIAHDGAVVLQINAESKGPFSWDVAKPLLLEVTREASGGLNLFINFENTEILQGKVWDLSFRADQQFVKKSNFSLDTHATKGNQLLERIYLREDRVIQNYGWQDWYYKLYIPRDIEGEPLRISLAITNIRDPEEGLVQRPNSSRGVSWNAGESLSAHGRLDNRENQYVRFQFNGEVDVPWRIRAVSPDKAVERIDLYEANGRLITSASRARKGESVMEITDFYPHHGEFIVGVVGANQDFRLEWVSDRDLIQKEGVRIPEGHWEREPNSQVSWAHLIHEEEFYIGRLRTTQDEDYYRFHNPGRYPEWVEFTIVPATDMELEVRMAGQIWRGAAGETFREVRRFLPGDHVFYLKSSSESDGFYQLKMDRIRTGKWDQDKSEPLSGITSKTRLEHQKVAAYWQYAQKASGALEITSRLSEGFKGKVELASGHANVEAVWKDSESTEIEVEIPANGTLTLPVDLVISPDLRHDYPVIVDFRLIDPQGRVHFDSFSLNAAVDQLGVNSHHRLPMPENMAGGMDVASAALGAEPQGDTSRPGREIEILQGLVRPGGSFLAELNKPFRIKLAGDESHPLAGFAIHPMNQLNNPRNSWLREFQIETSVDGENWELALKGALSAWAGEQYFPLNKEILAKHIRFTGLSQQEEKRERYYSLGALKAIARPGYLPKQLQKIDIASLNFGGHVVHSSPNQRDFRYLSSEDQRQSHHISMSRDHYGQSVEWVMGFHHNRLAKVDGVTLNYVTDKKDIEFPTEVQIEVAEETPLGPWQKVGSWTFPESIEKPWEIRFEEPVDARYVRFIYPLEWPEERAKTGWRYPLLPQKLHIWESMKDESARSILGEWGHYSRSGPFEWQNRSSDLAQGMLEEMNPGGLSAEQAVALSTEKWSQGYVSVGEREAYYKVEVQEGNNHLKIDIQGVPDIAWHYQLTDSQGNSVRIAENQAEDHLGRVLEGKVKPGTYYLRIWEPIRNIAIAWDNSGSMGPYLDPLYASIRTFLTQVDSKRERVQLLAFSDKPYFILKDWSGERSQLLQALLNYPRTDGSSDAEPNLAFISQQMENLEGTKAMLVLTDAESGGAGYAEQMWNSFAKTRPRIFTLETSSGGSFHTQDLMQDWADANYGIYDYMRSAGEVEIAFARANAHLRRIKYYRVRGGGVYVKPPEPGILQTVAEVPPAGSYYFIFDASGSMMAPIGDQRKFDVARDAVRNVIQLLPDEAQVALRIYGHTKRSTEEDADKDTALEVKMGPLSEAHRNLLLTKLERLRPRGRTPLTLSLAQAMRDVGGSREVTMVLLTDGGEDTVPRQDPVAEAAKIGAMKNVRLVVVGFDIQREDWSKQLSAIAEAASAPYLPAPQAADLEPMLRAASGFKPSVFQVLNEEGVTVAEGTFGDKISLEPGSYEIKSGEQTRSIRIHSEAVTTLSPF